MVVISSARTVSDVLAYCPADIHRRTVFLRPGKLRRPRNARRKRPTREGGVGRSLRFEQGLGTLPVDESRPGYQ